MAILKDLGFVACMDKNILYFYDRCQIISNNKNKELARAELDELYQYIKDVTSSYFTDNRLDVSYKYLKQSLLACEHSLPLEFIIDSNPNFSFGMIDDTCPNNADFLTKINWIVYMTRKHLFSKKKNKDFNLSDLADDCEKASNKVQELCKLVGLKSEQIIIYPGFCEYPELYEGNGYHFINLVSDGNNKVFVDCTYRQFFNKTYNNLNRIGIVDMSGCRAGIFMTMTDERKALAEFILKNGWFLASDENIKNYFDGFSLSYRNGLYYEITKDYSYTTKYTADDYRKFIRGLDRQINHEPLESLGFQRTLKPIHQDKY